MADDVPRVLVVDDEEHITELLFMGLSMNGFEVEGHRRVARPSQRSNRSPLTWWSST